MSSVTLINPFEVPEGQEEPFLTRWGQAADYMRQQEGFVSTNLHARLNATARFSFVNIAVWRSPEDFQRATNTAEFARISHQMPFAHFPGLYQLVVTG